MSDIINDSSLVLETKKEQQPASSQAKPPQNEKMKIGELIKDTPVLDINDFDVDLP